jgi:LPS-assembly lipoprotein
MSKRLVLLLLSFTLLTSCGFKLRGSFDMPASLSQVVIVGGERELVSTLSEMLVKSGSTILESGSEAASINIIKNEYEREVLTSSADGIASSYQFRYLVDFTVTDAAGKVLQPSISVNQVRSLNYEAGNELAIEDEVAFLKEGMEQEISLQIMRRLSRL